MADTTYIGQRVTNIEVSPQFQPYSRVIIHIDDDTEVIAGNATGRTLEIDNPFGNQQMANAILQSLSGYQYQPYTADGVLLDPAAEIGDAIETPAVHGGIYSRNRQFGRLMKADVAAPTDEEINHEYVFETPAERAYKRQVEDVKASFILTNNLIKTEVERASAAEGTLKSTIEQTATEINATVAEESAKKLDHTNTNQSFGWSLTASAFLLKNNNQTVFQFDANGLRFKSNGADVFTVTRTGGLYVKGNGEFTGTVTASSGKIGGFDIGATAMSYNGLTWEDTSKNYGVYIGQSGIQLGKNFKVDNSGGITASSLSLKGTLRFLNSDGTLAGTMSAADLRQGAQRANDGYSNWNSAYSSTSAGGYCYGGASGYYGGVSGGSSQPSNWHASTVWCDNSVRAAAYYWPATNSPMFDLATHHHKMSVDSFGNVKIGEPSATSEDFNIADTKFYKDGVAAVGGYSYMIDSSGISGNYTYLRAKITLTNGNTYYTGPMYVQYQ